MIARYLRAFVGALRMTLRGQAPAPSPLAPLRAWMAQTPALVAAVQRACDAAGMDATARKAATLVVEGRRLKLETALLTAQFHAQNEYPSLLAQPNDRTLGALYATNVNDAFLIARCAELVPEGAPRAALQGLVAHLRAAPDVSGEPVGGS
ncbi:MAG: hypothetical protein MUC99_11215 [Anaerolineae bacterium]|jgi:hypothetical protein|nr:hypothetical protein [Anaerolineae bacterium]